MELCPPLGILSHDAFFVLSIYYLIFLTLDLQQYFCPSRITRNSVPREPTPPQNPRTPPLTE